MESIRFADILFTLITLLITCAILWLVNKAKKRKKDSAAIKTAGDPVVVSEKEQEEPEQ